MSDCPKRDKLFHVSRTNQLRVPVQLSMRYLTCGNAPQRTCHRQHLRQNHICAAGREIGKHWETLLQPKQDGV